MQKISQTPKRPKHVPWWSWGHPWIWSWWWGCAHGRCEGSHQDRPNNPLNFRKNLIIATAVIIGNHIITTVILAVAIIIIIIILFIIINHIIITTIIFIITNNCHHHYPLQHVYNHMITSWQQKGIQTYILCICSPFWELLHKHRLTTRSLSDLQWGIWMMTTMSTMMMMAMMMMMVVDGSDNDDETTKILMETLV